MLRKKSIFRNVTSFPNNSMCTYIHIFFFTRPIQTLNHSLYYYYITPVGEIPVWVETRNSLKNGMLDGFNRFYLSPTIPINTRYRYYYYTVTPMSIDIVHSILFSLSLFLSLSLSPFLSLSTLIVSSLSKEFVSHGSQRDGRHFYSSRKIKACPITSPDSHEYFICIISRHAPPLHTFTRTLVHVSHHLRRIFTRSFFSSFFYHPGIHASWNSSGIVSRSCCRKYGPVSVCGWIARVECKRTRNANRTRIGIQDGCVHEGERERERERERGRGSVCV